MGKSTSQILNTLTEKKLYFSIRKMGKQFAGARLVTLVTLDAKVTQSSIIICLLYLSPSPLPSSVKSCTGMQLLYHVNSPKVFFNYGNPSVGRTVEDIEEILFHACAQKCSSIGFTVGCEYRSRVTRKWYQVVRSSFFSSMAFSSPPRI